MERALAQHARATRSAVCAKFMGEHGGRVLLYPAHVGTWGEALGLVSNHSLYCLGDMLSGYHP